MVAAVLLDSAYLGEAMKAVQPGDFADDRLRRIFAGMVKMRGAGEPIDALTVSGKLPDWGIQGISAVELHSWVGEVFTASNVSYYGEIVAREALQRGVVKVATQLREDADRPADAIREGMRELEALQKRHASDDVVIRNFAQLLEVDAAHDWLISGLIERKDRLMLTGPEGFGKSLMLQQIVFAVAAGVHPFRDYNAITPRRCLVVDVENTERQWKRRADMFGAAVQSVSGADLSESLFVWNSRRLDITKSRDLSSLHQAVDEVKPDLVMIGPLYRLTPGAIQTDDEAAPVLAALDTLRDRDLALLIEAHAGKAIGDRGERNLAPRGSSALLGWPEFGLGLRPVKGKPDEAELVRWRGDREERMWPKRLRRSRQGLPWQEVVQS